MLEQLCWACNKPFCVCFSGETPGVCYLLVFVSDAWWVYGFAICLNPRYSSQLAEYGSYGKWNAGG